MSKLSGGDPKTVFELLGDKKAYFFIPDYQRPYAWNKSECDTLWNDLFNFAFPNNDYTAFNSAKDEYFLGSIVTYLNQEKHEVIDGQQRIVTLMLLLRAFYNKFDNMQDENSIASKKAIEQCIWKTNEFGKPNINSLKLETEVAIDEARHEFQEILKTGKVFYEHKSLYANNYRFFQEKVEDFLHNFGGYLAYFPMRILNNCIFLPITADSQETAMVIFSTLNDRGKPLSDADIFKAQLYKYYRDVLHRKDEFVQKWKEFEELCSEIYHPKNATPMDEAFARYMYYERAKLKIKDTTTTGIRKFYDSYAIFKKDKTFENIIDLAKFWEAVSNLDEKFSERVLKRLFVLNYAPNDMWTNITSVYYLANRSDNGILDDEKFYNFLNKLTAFIWGYSFINPGVNALRMPIYDAMIDIVEGKQINFSKYKLDIQQLTNAINNYVFSNNSAMTRPMLTWWALNNEKQKLLKLNEAFQIEHIYAKKRFEFEKGLTNPANLDLLGNKSLLEKEINIRAADYRFPDKVKYYKGEKGKKKEKTKIQDILEIIEKFTDFTESDIVQRNALIIQRFIDYLKKNDLIK